MSVTAGRWSSSGSPARVIAGGAGGGALAARIRFGDGSHGITPAM
ncbi:hypothetical protein GCM10009678_18130 [Actinomadura kijaniata]